MPHLKITVELKIISIYVYVVQNHKKNGSAIQNTSIMVIEASTIFGKYYQIFN